MRGSQGSSGRGTAQNLAAYPIDLPRPRNLTDIKSDSYFQDLYRTIRRDLRTEVLKVDDRIREYYLGASMGIGYLIAQAEGVFDTTGMFAGTMLLAFAVLGIGAIVSRVERRLLRWKPAQNAFREDQLP